MKARGRAINVHMISEVFYGGGWHMIDGSLMNYFFMPDGSLASADEIHKAVVQWHEKNPGYRTDWGKLTQFAAKGNWRKAGPPLLATCPTFLESGFNPAGVHGWHATMGEYDFKNAPDYEYWPSMGYQLNVQLREGEKLTRNWSNKGKVIDWADADIMEGGKGILDLQRNLATRPPAGSATASWNTTCRWPAAGSAAGPCWPRTWPPAAKTGPPRPSTSRTRPSPACSCSACPPATSTWAARWPSRPLSLAAGAWRSR